MNSNQWAVASLAFATGFGEVRAADTSAAPLEEVMVTSSRIERPLSTIPNTVTVIGSAE